MAHGRQLVLVVMASLSPGVLACGGSTGPLNTASVVTDTVTLVDSMYNDSSWSVPVGDGPSATFSAKVATLSLPAITSTIAANGLVLVYINTDTSADSTPQWTPLPFSVAFDYLQTFTFAYAPGQIKIGFYLSETDATFGPPNVYAVTVPTAQFKIVVANGSAASLLAERLPLREYDSRELVTPAR